jgi:hypothetical protein
MFRHFWSARARALRRHGGDPCNIGRWALAARLISPVLHGSILSGLMAACWATAASAQGVETEHLFGFTTGSDSGEKGETEIESETTGRTAKGSGSYSALTQQFEARHTLDDRFRISGAAAFALHAIGNVPDLADRRQAAFQGASFDARYRLVERERAPFGLTLVAEPHWNRIDDVTGALVENHGATLTPAMDKELIAHRLYAAVNVIYEPEVTRFAITNAWVRQASFALSGAVAVAVKDGVFVGAEIRSVELYDGLGFDSFAGRALFVGPTYYAKLSEHWWTSIAWNVQVTGRTATRTSALDLVNFEQQQAKIRFGYHF